MLAATQAVTGTLCARVSVITIDSLADTNTSFAVITNRAGIPVEAFALIQGLVLTAALSFAGVDRASVAIVAGVFVRQAVAVIIDAVACLGRRIGGRAIA